MFVCISIVLSVCLSIVLSVCLSVRVQDFTLELSDDPFEVKLGDNYAVSYCLNDIVYCTQ